MKDMQMKDFIAYVNKYGYFSKGRHCVDLNGKMVEGTNHRDKVGIRIRT